MTKRAVEASGGRALALTLPAVVTATGAAVLHGLGVAWPIALAGGAVLGIAAGLLHAKKDEEQARAMAAELERLRSGVEEHIEIAKLATDSNPDAVVFFDDGGGILYANPAARELFFEGEAPEGKNFLRLLASAPEALRQALSGDTERLFNVEVEGQRETYHVCRCGVTMNRAPHTMLIVKLLTKEISRREVDTLKTVVRVISHEVNNSLAPITSLVSSARLMLDKPEHLPKLSTALDTIEERARHLQGFLEAYAGLARLPRPRPAEVSFVPLLDHVRALYPDVLVPEAPVEQGFFDAAQIEQVLINVIKNAIEAGSATEQVELSARVENDGATRFEVADRGRGLSGEALESALLPLYTTKEKGSGIGLTICREIVDAHGGSLGIANRNGGGAVVCIMLPGKAKPDPALQRSRAKLTLSRA